MKIYLSGACEYAIDKGQSWRIKITPKLQVLGYQVIDPTQMTSVKDHQPKGIWELKQTDYKLYSKYLNKIAWIELDEVSRCNIILAKIDKAVFSGCGTYMELAIGFFTNKQNLLWLEDITPQECPGFLLGIYDKIFFSEEKILEYLKDFNKEKEG